MSWKHYPNSPWGDIDICRHGVTRFHGDKNKHCVYCDYPENTNLKIDYCKICQASTWHLDGKCIRCDCLRPTVTPQDSKGERIK